MPPAPPTPPHDRSGFRVALICALPLEADCVQEVFDKFWEDEGKEYGKAQGDDNQYTPGVVGKHNVVLAYMPGMGVVSAAAVAVAMRISYPNITLALVVGVCGGMPYATNKSEIRLGDVIISQALIQYDFGRQYPAGFERKTGVQDTLGRSGPKVRSVQARLGTNRYRRRMQNNLTISLESILQNLPEVSHPGPESDKLFQSTYTHRHRWPKDCKECNENGRICEAALQAECEDLGCDTTMIVPRGGSVHILPRPPAIHFGIIGSGNSVMKSGHHRDQLATAEEIIALEMEGAGVWDCFPSVIIKGVCDYADSHKRKGWQRYAAATAAACAKAFLVEWTPEDMLSVSENTSTTLSHSDMSFHSSGGVQTNNVNSGDGQQINNNAAVGAQYIVTRHREDFNFNGPAGLCLGQAPNMNPKLFVGRESDMRKIEDILHPSDGKPPHRLAILGGKGGIGKTQLAITYANRYQHHYESVFWLNATTEAALKASFGLIARQVFDVQDLDSLEGDGAYMKIARWLSDRRNTRWLVVFDNYDDPKEFDIRLYYPPASHGTIIVTTRRPDLFAGESEEVRVEPFSDVQESLEILATRAQRQNARTDPDAARIARRLGGLPLALATAGAYLRTSPLSFARYLQEYEERWEVNQRRRTQLGEYPDRTLFTTWQLSYDRLKTEDLEAAQLLKLLAYFDNQHMWYELFRAGLTDGSPEELHKVMVSDVEFAGVMQTLSDYCFIEIQQSTQSWSMHNCVHDWTLAVLNKDIDMHQYWYTFACVASSIDEYDWDILGHLSYAQLAAHATRLVHQRFRQHGRLDSMTVDQVEGAVYIAQLLSSQVRLSEGEQMYERALAGKEKALGPEHTSTLDTVNNLGLLYSDQGKLDQAEQMYERALAGLEKALGPEHTSTLDTVHNLGSLYADRGKLD